MNFYHPSTSKLVSVTEFIVFVQNLLVDHFQVWCKISQNDNRIRKSFQTRNMLSTPSSTAWISPFLLGASASLSIVWLAQKLKRSSPAIPKEKLERKRSLHGKGEEVLDHEELSNRMLRKAEAVIQWRTSRLVIVIERCTNGM